MKTGLVFSGAEGRQRHVGQIRTTITLENRSDMEAVERGDLQESAVRRFVFDRVLVDIGANLLALPAATIAALGVKVRREVDVETAAGFQKANIFRGCELTVDVAKDRSITVDCLELPGGESVLLGVLPLEELGIDVDIQNHRLIVLPDRGPDTYVMAL